MLYLAHTFLKDESGTTAVEYGLIATLICVALIGGARSAGISINSLWNSNAEIAGEVLSTSGQ